jgi:YegS/Rv2252/BmrU family lipid kinase
MSPRTLVIVNPRSRGGANRHFARVEEALRSALGPIEVEWTRAPRDAERIAREGVRAGVERLVIAGGDGTTSEVVSGLLGADLARYADLAILPLGTGSDLLRTIGIPRDLNLALQQIAEGTTRCIDVGRITYHDPEGKEKTSHFANVTSMGISGLVMKFVNSTTKALGERISFLIGTLRGLAHYRTQDVKLALDGETIHAGPLVLAVAANGSFFGGGMRVAPGARPDDGLLDVVVIPDYTKLRLLRELPRIYRGTHVDVEGVLSRRGLCLEASALPGAEGGAPSDVWIEVDGEPLGTLPVRVEILPKAISVLGAR